jgi:hypothetical protein
MAFQPPNQRARGLLMIALAKPGSMIWIPDRHVSIQALLT